MDIYERPDHLFDEEPPVHDHLEWNSDQITFGESIGQVPLRSHDEDVEETEQA
jgi:hypothetical protein